MKSTALAAAIAASLFVPIARAEDDTLHEIVVTAVPIAAATGDLTQPVTLLAGDALRLDLAPSLGETLTRQPGISSTFFGPAASRPVIRGIGGDRVQVLTDGLASLDVSGLSEDHAVAVEPALAQQIEIVRGPATLLYGSGAAGGVVNVVTTRLHERRHEGVSGVVEARGETALDEKALSGRLDAGVGRLQLHVDGSWRDTNDYSIPGFTESRRQRELDIAEGGEPSDERGTVENSWTRTKSGGAGLSYVGDSGMLGVAFSRFDTRYGIPGGHEHDHEEEEGEEEHEEEGGVSIDMKQERLDLAGRLDLGNGFIDALRLRGFANWYEHAEVEPDGAIGTLFKLDARELRLTLEQATIAGFDGVFGLQWSDVDFYAEGEEAFVPGSQTKTLALFGFEQRDFGRWSAEFGARVERKKIEPDAASALPGYKSTALSLSAGALWKLGEDHGIALNVTRTERHPTSTELYADGPHAATGQYEIGDASFGRERALTFDLGLRRTAGPLRYEISAYLNHFDGYIYLADTGLETPDDEALPVFQFTQRDATFRGFEASVEVPLAVAGGTLTVGAMGDYVRGKLSNGGGDLPRLPPLRVGGSVKYERGPFGIAVEARHAFAQKKIADYELATSGYTMLEADVTYTLELQRSRLLVFLRGRNLLDEDARLHTSPLKEDLPLPGRGVTAGVRLQF
jgi:iron complex outermembrane receptor protein